MDMDWINHAEAQADMAVAFSEWLERFQVQQNLSVADLLSLLRDEIVYHVEQSGEVATS